MRSLKGFSLVEVLISIVILSGASVFIFGAFFRSLGAIDEVSDRLGVLYELHAKIEEVRLALATDKPIIHPNGQVVIDRKPYFYEVREARYGKPLASLCLSRVNVIYYWFEGAKRQSVGRELLCWSRHKYESKK